MVNFGGVITVERQLNNFDIMFNITQYIIVIWAFGQIETTPI